MATEGNGRVQRILDEFRAEAKASFGSNAGPLARSIRQESTARSIGKMLPPSRPEGVSEEVKASLLLAVETALLPEVSALDDAAIVVRTEGTAKTRTKGNDVSAIQAEAIATELPPSRPNVVSEEVKVSLLLAVETALLPELSALDDAAIGVRTEGTAKARAKGNDVSAILAEAIAKELLTDETAEADIGSVLKEEKLASLENAFRQVERDNQPGIQGLRTAIEEAAEPEARPSRASLDAKDREILEQAFARSLDEPRASE